MVAGNNKQPTTPPPSSSALSPSSTQTTPPPTFTSTADEASARQLNKRYEGLLMVRNKAVRGKGAWYWAHFEPLLVHNPDTGLPKAVKLKCRLCEALFSASNPSRTASEHLKRGTCPNFTMASFSSVAVTGNSPSTSPRPISSLSPATTTTTTTVSGLLLPPIDSPIHNRKRGSAGRGGGGVAHAAISSYQTVSPLSMIEPPPPPTRYTQETGFSSASPSPIASIAVVPGGAGSSSFPYHHHQQQHHFGLSGGKDDLASLAMFKDNVKRLKSPKTSPGPALSKAQIDYALDCLADWVYEFCGSVPFSSLEHPKFRSFLNQLGLPPISKREFSGSKLDAKYEEVKAETEARIQDAMFFQLSSDGWRENKQSSEDSLVNMTVNLPNGTSVFRRAVFTAGQQVSSIYAEEVLWETIEDICGVSNVDGKNKNNGLSSTASTSTSSPLGFYQCGGIVADRFKHKALRNLENQHQWMVNLYCQYQGLFSLIKDFYRELPLFKNVTQICTKLASFVNYNTQVRNLFRKYRLQEYGHSGLLRVPHSNPDGSGGSSSSRTTTTTATTIMDSVFAMFDDIVGSARALQLVIVDDSYKLVLLEDPFAREFSDMVRDAAFWNELEAVRSVVKLIKETAHEIETERPRVGQCLPIWEELRVKIKDWCAKFHIIGVSGELVEKLVERRFKKNYHPAWSAAYILDPVHLIRDTSGKYLPPFKHLTPQQERDVDKMVTRLVSREEAHIVLMELMKWRTEGLDPDYAQAVQMKQRDPMTGKMKVAIPQSGRLVWETYLTELRSLGKVAVRLLFLHATCRGFKCGVNSSSWVRTVGGRSKYGKERAQKMVFVAANWKMERKEFGCSDEDKDADLFATEFGNGGGEDDDDPLNEVFVDASTM